MLANVPGNGIHSVIWWRPGRNLTKNEKPIFERKSVCAWNVSKVDAQGDEWATDQARYGWCSLKGKATSGWP